MNPVCSRFKENYQDDMDANWSQDDDANALDRPSKWKLVKDTFNRGNAILQSSSIKLATSEVAAASRFVLQRKDIRCSDKCMHHWEFALEEPKGSVTFFFKYKSKFDHFGLSVLMKPQYVKFTLFKVVNTNGNVEVIKSISEYYENPKLLGFKLEAKTW